jgi:tRNA nucleotidyltransferase (CCA-adding enzyme)
MRKAAPGLAHVSAERIGGGIKADGQGELSKLLLGPAPERALLLARDTGVLTEMIPEFGPAIGYSLGSERQPLPLEEHIFAVVQRSADAGDPLEVRLACLLHDLAKPETDASPARDHARAGAAIADRILRRLRYPTRVRHRVVQIIGSHGFRLDGEVDARAARRFLAAHGDELADDLLRHKAADLAAKRVPEQELEWLAEFRATVLRESSQPHRIRDLAIDGDDLKQIGFVEGPELGGLLRALLADVVDDPKRNDPAWLLERASRELP